MSSEHIYHYYHEIPEYKPNKFDIVGGFANPVNDNDLEFDMSFETDELIPAIVVGGNRENYNRSQMIRSASTAEENLLELFGRLDRKFIKPIKDKKKPKIKKVNLKHNPKKPKKQTKLRKKRGGDDENSVVRLSDVSDEMLYYCPTGGDSTDSTDSTDSNSINDIIGGNDTMEDSNKDSNNDEDNDEDNINSSSLNDDQIDLAALESVFSGSAENTIDENDDTDITRFLI